MDSHPFDILSLENDASLIFTPCPGTKGVELETSVQQLKDAGAKAIITTMPNDEMKQFKVEALPQVCEQQGLQWFHLPIEDDQAPSVDFHTAWEKYKLNIQHLIDDKKSLAIHCVGGSGRTGLMAAILMLERGMGFEETLSMVKSLRPNSLKKPPHVAYLTKTYQ